MIPSKVRGILLCVVLAACADKPPKAPTLNQALPNLPLPPDASFVGRAGGSDALQITVHSPTPVDSVAAYYRKVLNKSPWRLVNDAKDAEGAVVLFAQQNGPPLWVRIRRAEGGRGTLVDISGAVVPKRDSTATPAARPAS
jgi:hypothetical protein